MNTELPHTERTPSAETALSHIFEVMELPLPWDERQMQIIALAEKLSAEQKIAAFEQLQTALTREEKELLGALTDAADLLGRCGAEVQHLVGDEVFDKIMNVVIIVRLKNTPTKTDEGHVYNFTELQLEKLRGTLSAVPKPIQNTVWPIMMDLDFLNSPVIALRERTKLLFSIIRVIQQYFEKPQNEALITEATTNQISKLRVETTQLIGYMNNLKFR